MQKKALLIKYLLPLLVFQLRRGLALLLFRHFVLGRASVSFCSRLPFPALPKSEKELELVCSAKIRGPRRHAMVMTPFPSLFLVLLSNICSTRSDKLNNGRAGVHNLGETCQMDFAKTRNDKVDKPMILFIDSG
jgi:hypothetical protein